jgi:hypothetical protein
MQHIFFKKASKPFHHHVWQRLREFGRRLNRKGETRRGWEWLQLGESDLQ